jgi:hypothetical protein
LIIFVIVIELKPFPFPGKGFFIAELIRNLCAVVGLTRNPRPGSNWDFKVYKQQYLSQTAH